MDILSMAQLHYTYRGPNKYMNSHSLGSHNFLFTQIMYAHQWAYEYEMNNAARLQRFTYWFAFPLFAGMLNHLFHEVALTTIIVTAE